MGLIGAVTGALSGTARRVWSGGDRVHVEVKVAAPAELDAFTARLEQLLDGQPGVEWSELTPGLGRVVIAADPGVVDGGRLIELVEAVEAEFGVHRAPFVRGGPGHPSDSEPIVREAVKVAADLVGIGLGVVGRVAFVGPGRALGTAGTVVAVANGVPTIRRIIDSRFGSPAVEMVLGVGNALGQGLAQAPLGPLADLVYHGATLVELDARRRAWIRREPELFDKPWRAAEPVLPPPRPGPLPDGPIERFTNQIWGAAGIGAGIMAVSSRDVARGAAVLGISLPKAAIYGRGLFASALCRTLSERGILVMRPEVLRVLDRVDTLVVEADLLVTDEVVVGEVLDIGTAERTEVRSRLRGLFDPGRADTIRRDGDWVLGPLEDLDVAVPDGMRRQAAQLGRLGAPVLGVVRGGRLAALVETRVALRPEAEDLVALARGAGLELLLVCDPTAAVVPVEADRTVSPGHLTDEILALQSAGRVVAVVASDDRMALAAADCGIGLRPPGAAPPWSADVICSDGLLDVCFLVESCGRAREVSRQSARLALAGASVGAFMTFRSFPGAALGAGTAVNAAALVSMANGARAAVQLARQPRPLPRDPTPWHALDGAVVLGRLGVSVDGLPAREAVGRRPPRDAPLPPVLRFARDVVDEVFNPLTPVLAVGAGLSLVTGSAGDAGMVLAVVGLNAVIGGVQRYRADDAFAAIERTGRRRAVVKRDGAEVTIDADDVVVGDVVVLRAGDAVT
ncbi:MAG TPA: hypothetical protein VGR20_02895, partial [Acidimicrobiia bacterium]|nr:hypothetical protein [Acidimicrobiia bacterium]